MSFKDNDPCRDKAADDEPIFTLRAQDILAPETIRHWATQVQLINGWGRPRSAKIEEALAVADEMVAWARAHGSKIPD